MMPQLLKHTTVKIRPVIGFGLSIYYYRMAAAAGSTEC